MTKINVKHRTTVTVGHREIGGQVCAGDSVEERAIGAEASCLAEVRAVHARGKISDADLAEASEALGEKEKPTSKPKSKPKGPGKASRQQLTTTDAEKPTEV